MAEETVSHSKECLSMSGWTDSVGIKFLKPTINSAEKVGGKAAVSGSSLY